MSVEYQIVQCYDYFLSDAIIELENKIKSLCNDHWEPTGGISICQDDSHFFVFQSMIRKPR